MIAESVWVLTLICLALLSAIFIYVIFQSKQTEDYSQVQSKWYSWRSKWIIFLFVFGIVVTVATLLPFPIIKQSLANPNATIVNVVGHQWYWTVDNKEYTVGEPVEFHVTSKDVNHGLGIYDKDDRLITQVQAMPGYVNKLAYTFDKPGVYRILCLEFCGTAHHIMTAELTVK